MADMPSPPLYLDPNLQIVFGVSLMAVLGVSSITPAFPGVGRALDVPSQTVAHLITAFTLPGVLFTPILGILTDRWGRKQILIPALALFGIAGGACALARDISVLLALRFVQGIGAAALNVLYITLIGDLYSRTRQTAAMGYNASVISVGTAVFPAIGGGLASVAWYYPFLLPLLAIPLALLALFVLENPEPEGQQALSTYLRQTWTSVKHGQAVVFLLLTLLTFVIIYGAYLTYLPFLMEDAFQASPVVIGIVMSGTSVATALASSQLGRLANRFSEGLLLQIACGSYALALVLIPRVTSPPLLAVPAVLFGLGQGLSIPNLQTSLASLAPIEHRGAFLSANALVLRVGQTLGPPLMAVASSVGGMVATFHAGAAIALAMLVLAATSLRKRRTTDDH